MSGQALIAAEQLIRRYRGRGNRHITALAGVSLAVLPGESVAVVGESGSGKSTLVRCIAALERADAGRVRWAGEDVWSLGPEVLRQRRRQIQVIFQDSLAAFNPRCGSARTRRCALRCQTDEVVRDGRLGLTPGNRGAMMATAGAVECNYISRDRHGGR